MEGPPRAFCLGKMIPLGKKLILPSGLNPPSGNASSPRPGLPESLHLPACSWDVSPGGDCVVLDLELTPWEGSRIRDQGLESRSWGD